MRVKISQCSFYETLKYHKTDIINFMQTYRLFWNDNNKFILPQRGIFLTNKLKEKNYKKFGVSVSFVNFPKISFGIETIEISICLFTGCVFWALFI